MNKFKAIYADLKQRILAKEYPADTLLPSENTLAETYQTSRETIRKALNLLQETGYITKKQGKGSIVVDLERFDFPLSHLTSFRELQKELQLDEKTVVNELKKIPLSEELSERTGWSTSDEVWKVVRQRQIDGEFVILDTDYLLASIVEDLPMEHAQNSIYHYLEDIQGLSIAYAQKDVTVDDIPEDCQNLIDFKDGDKQVVMVRSLVYLDDNRCFQYTESAHRMDKFRFTDFARRIKK
ncbi:MAG: trehalose operon repressor [Aerococcus sp.]|nr:trehalose operon repressor [Aerococcus sp.]